MRISFKSFWGEGIMFFPNINFWSDDDPDYAPQKYMFFIGWLWWGAKVYFGKRAESKQGDRYYVQTIYNKFRDKRLYVICDRLPFNTPYVGQHTLDVDFSIAHHPLEGWTFRSNTPIAVAEAIRRSQEIRSYELALCEFPVLAWDDDRDATLVCNYLCSVDDMQRQDHWKILDLPLPSHVLS